MELSDIIPTIQPLNRNLDEEQADVKKLTKSENKHVKVFPKLTMKCLEAKHKSNLRSLWIVSLFQGMVAFGMLIVQWIATCYINHVSAELLLSFWISIAYSALASLFSFLVTVFQRFRSTCFVPTAFLFQSCSILVSFTFFMMWVGWGAITNGCNVPESEQFFVELLFVLLNIPSAITAGFGVKLLLKIEGII